MLGKGEQTRRYDTVITPPGYAFVIWAPIFAGCALSTVGQCLPDGRSHPVSRRSGWPLAGAYAANTAWSLAAQSDRFTATPLLLAAGVARSRRGALPLAAASGWGLLTTALAMGRPRSVRVAAGAGVVMLVAAVRSAATRRG
ncbi:hypothetical protein AB0H28_28555 [Micromonospora sp. NPDC050980]|uniref:hypothetical protein n=1 Tax=Micromonospora sp. NPDC050980 TaxID=3155161 RepID=UPI0033D750B4